MKCVGFLLWLGGILGATFWPIAAASAAPGPPDTVVLRQQLATALPDTTRLRLLNDLCYSLHDEQPTRALVYGEEAVVLARRLPNQSPQLLEGLLALASCYGNLSNGPQALRLLGEAQTLARRLNSTDGLVRAYHAQGSIYHERGDSATAWQHYHRALLLAEQPEVTPRTRMKLLGNVGSLFFYRKQYARALHFDSLALALARRWSDRTAESNYLSSLGTYQIRVGNLPRARRLLTQALTISRQQGAVRNQANQLLLFALYYIETGQPDRVDSVTREALRLARQSGFLERVLDAYDILGREASERRDYDQAYAWTRRYVDLNDTLNSRQTMQTLAATQASFENQERERHIRLLTQQHDLQTLRNRLLAGAVVLLGLALLVSAYLYQKLRRSRAALASSHAALKKASTELRAVAVFKDKLYAIVAHDLRGPVMAFAGVTGMIDTYMQQNDQANLARLPAIVRQAAESLNRLLDNVLNWAVSQTGELSYRPEVLAVAALFGECQSLYHTTAEAGQQQITAAAADGLCIRADHNMVRTVLRNLVGNALKFMPLGGHVHLEATPDPADPLMVLLSCTDTGPGMSPETVAGLMNGTALPVPTRSRHSAGLGLGLTLCRAFVHRHGGTLVIQSRPGAGTNVMVSLPAATVITPATASVSQPATPQPVAVPS
jgi:signal transduction histidine kinase